MAERISTTFYSDFGIADRFGIAAIKDTYNRVFRAWKDDYRYWTEVVMALNARCWLWSEKDDDLMVLYRNLYYKARDWALDHFKGEELRFFWEVTD